jgi:hypothetical protein
VEILRQISDISKVGKCVVFCWVPGHTGLPGNEAADTAAKETAAHGILASERALGNGSCSSLSRNFIFLAGWVNDYTGQEIAVSETIRRGVAVLQLHQEKEGPTYAPFGWAHSPGTC